MNNWTISLINKLILDKLWKFQLLGKVLDISLQYLMLIVFDFNNFKNFYKINKFGQLVGLIHLICLYYYLFINKKIYKI